MTCAIARAVCGYMLGNSLSRLMKVRLNCPGTNSQTSKAAKVGKIYRNLLSHLDAGPLHELHVIKSTGYRI